ncbi:MAG: hypothetical protein IJP59_10335 [Muribaculaceae bacterium]|nr:hypothetical protein [Muribaculaceae bacterium]
MNFKLLNNISHFLRCKVSNYLPNRKAKHEDFANKRRFFVQKLFNEAQNKQLRNTKLPFLTTALN